MRKVSLVLVGAIAGAGLTGVVTQTKLLSSTSAVAASAEGDGTVAGRDTVRRVLGLINKVLDFRTNPYLYRFTFIGYSIVPHPRQSAVVGVARFETHAIFGKE